MAGIEAEARDRFAGDVVRMLNEAGLSAKQKLLAGDLTTELVKVSVAERRRFVSRDGCSRPEADRIAEAAFAICLKLSADSRECDRRKGTVG